MGHPSMYKTMVDIIIKSGKKNTNNMTAKPTSNILLRMER